VKIKEGEEWRKGRLKSVKRREKVKRKSIRDRSEALNLLMRGRGRV
jgi:hypothetical protein